MARRLLTMFAASAIIGVLGIVPSSLGSTHSKCGPQGCGGGDFHVPKAHKRSGGIQSFLHSGNPAGQKCGPQGCGGGGYRNSGGIGSFMNSAGEKKCGPQGCGGGDYGRSGIMESIMNSAEGMKCGPQGCGGGDYGRSGGIGSFMGSAGSQKCGPQGCGGGNYRNFGMNTPLNQPQYFSAGNIPPGALDSFQVIIIPASSRCDPDGCDYEPPVLKCGPQGCDYENFQVIIIPDYKCGPQGCGSRDYVAPLK